MDEETVCGRQTPAKPAPVSRYAPNAKSIYHLQTNFADDPLRFTDIVPITYLKCLCRMKDTDFTLLTFALFLVFFVPPDTANAERNPHTCDKDRLKEIAERTDEKLPNKISKISTWYKTRSNKCRLEHYYRYAYEKGKITRDMIFKTKYDKMKRKVCKPGLSNNLLSRGVTLVYNFFGSEGKKIASFTFRQSDCRE